MDEHLSPLQARMWDYAFPLERRKRAKKTAFYETLLQGHVVTGATAAFRSTFVRDLIPFPEGVANLIHDGWIALAVSFMSEVAFIEAPLVRYRQHGQQQLGARNNDHLRFVTPESLIAAIEQKHLHREIL